MKYYDKETKSFFAGKGFYLVLAFCLLAVGAAAWSAYSAFTGLGTAENTQSVSSTAKVEKKQSYVSKEEPTASSEIQSSSSEVSSSKKQVTSSAPERPAANYFVLPVTGEVIKGFSDTALQYSVTYNDRRLHTGIDIAADSGTPVKASGDGTVTEVGKDELYGNCITVDHGNGIVARYCGLADGVKVKKGDTVKGGKVIGSVGNIPSETLDKSHLHLEFLKDGKPVSPLKVMGLSE